MSVDWFLNDKDHRHERVNRYFKQQGQDVTENGILGSGSSTAFLAFLLVVKHYLIERRGN